MEFGFSWTVFTSEQPISKIDHFSAAFAGVVLFLCRWSRDMSIQHEDGVL